MKKQAPSWLGACFCFLTFFNSKRRVDERLSQKYRMRLTKKQSVRHLSVSLDIYEITTIDSAVFLKQVRL